MLRTDETMARATDFSSFVDGQIRAQLKTCSTFSDLVSALPGVLPDEALNSLRRIGGEQAELVAADALVDRADRILNQGIGLPLPHPLDSEFRFCEDTAQLLAESLVDATRDGDELLLIGVPTVAIALATMDVDRTVRFLGPDNCVTAAVREAFAPNQLVMTQGPGGTAAAALLDPPWYREPMHALIGAGASGCRAGALLKLVIPPLGTRPEIAADRHEFLNSANSFGLVCHSGAGSVWYRTPLFELAAMEQQGIARLSRWRRGDVLDFRLEGFRGPPATWSPPRHVELTYRGARLRLVHGAQAAKELARLSTEEVFPSVSVRAARRNEATLWTTTNRAFLVDFDAARAALAYLADIGQEVLHSRFSGEENYLLTNRTIAHDNRLIHQLVELIEREFRESRRLVGDGAWLETTMEWRS